VSATPIIIEESIPTDLFGPAVRERVENQGVRKGQDQALRNNTQHLQTFLKMKMTSGIMMVSLNLIMMGTFGQTMMNAVMVALTLRRTTESTRKDLSGVVAIKSVHTLRVVLGAKTGNERTRLTMRRKRKKRTEKVPNCWYLLRNSPPFFFLLFRSITCIPLMVSSLMRIL
jgi:hypothetical protein